MNWKNSVVFSFLVLMLGTAIVSFGAAQDYLNQIKFMSLEDAQKRWGRKPFSPENF